jgi:hypothetical protein
MRITVPCLPSEGDSAPVNTPHDPHDDLTDWDDDRATPTLDDEHWWPRLIDRINRWWMDPEPTGPALRQMAAIPPKRAVAGILAVIAALVLLIGSLLWWLISAIVGAVAGIADAIRTGSGHATQAGTHDLAAWSLTRTITDPVHGYLTGHTAGLPVAADTLWLTWLATTSGLFLLATLGARGARIGWALAGITTAGMVYAGTPATGRAVAAGLTVTVWAVLSVIAYNRLTPLDRPLHISIPIPRRPDPDYRD